MTRITIREMLAWTLSFALLTSLFVAWQKTLRLESYRRQVFGHYFIFERYGIKVTYDHDLEVLHYSKPFEGGRIEIKDLSFPLHFEEHDVGPDEPSDESNLAKSPIVG
jgi:hypothetical protein